MLPFSSILNFFFQRTEKKYWKILAVVRHDKLIPHLTNNIVTLWRSRCRSPPGFSLAVQAQAQTQERGSKFSLFLVGTLMHAISCVV